jgi:hypothetical protein
VIILVIDSGKVTEAIITTGLPALALEEGSGLVDGWIANYANDTAQIVAVEAGFSIRLDELTWAIGVADLIASDDKGLFLDEHKSTAAPSRYWTEEKWLESIRSGPQIALYALALRDGTFYHEGSPLSWGIVNYPIRVRVRAAVKTAVPIFWPRDPADGWQEYDEKALRAVADAFRVKAAAIRAARKSGLVPWQLRGRQCTEFNRRCAQWERCSEYRGIENGVGFDGNDPAARLALPFLPPEAQSPDAVILSASSYQTYSKCMELGRIEAAGGEKEESLALNIGTVLHAGLARYYELVREEQQRG